MSVGYCTESEMATFNLNQDYGYNSDPAEVISAAIIHRAVARRHASPLPNGPPHTTASRTCLIFSASDIDSQSRITPIQKAVGITRIPIEKLHEITIHAALNLITEEDPVLANTYLETLAKQHVHRTWPHADLFRHPHTKDSFRASQIGRTPSPAPKRPLKPRSYIGSDGIPF